MGKNFPPWRNFPVLQYYAVQMCPLCSRKAPILVKMSLSRSKNESVLHKKYDHYAQEMCLLCSRNVPLMLKKCTYYTQEMCILCSRKEPIIVLKNMPIMLKKCS